MKNSKTIFIFLVAMSLAVSVSIFVVSSALGQDKPKRAKRGGIIGALEGVLKDMEKEEGGKKVEDQSGQERKKFEGEEEQTNIPDPDKATAGMPDELGWEGDFIREEGERKESASTTDEEGNTTTVYRTKNGVWIKKVTDKNGNVILEERKIETADGGKKVEIIDYKTGKKTQEVYDAMGKLVSSLTIDEKKKTRTRAIYIGGIISGSKSIDGQGNITRTTYKNGKVEYSDTKDAKGNTKKTVDHEIKNGFDVVRVIDYEKGTTTKSTTAPDGSTMFRTEDNETGETIHEVAVTADGGILEYKTGRDADKAFESGEVISSTAYSTTQDWIEGTESRVVKEFQHKDQSELDRQLKDQMAEGEAVSGESIIISSTFKERTRVSQREGPDGAEETYIERIASSSEVRGVDPNGPYEVKSIGEPVSAEGYGETPSEALSNALDSAAGTVITKIKSEFLDRMHSTQKTDGGKVTQWSSDEDRTSTLDASSFAVFKGYEVESVGVEDGQYVVKVKAQPGITLRK